MSAAVGPLERGAFGLVFRLSRVLGFAPVLRNGSYRVSRALLVYGIINGAIAGTYGVALITLVFQFKMTTAWLAVDVLHIACTSLVVAVYIVGALTARTRLMLMGTHLEHLDEMYATNCRKENGKDRKAMVMILVHILGCAMLRPTEFSPIKMKYFEERWEGYLFLFVYMIIHHSMDLLIMQQALFARRILRALESVNDSLQRLLPDQIFFNTTENNIIYDPETPVAICGDRGRNIRNNLRNVVSHRNRVHAVNVENKNLTVEAEPAVPQSLRRLAKHYMKICDIIRDCNSNDGFLMIIMLVSYILYMEKYMYKVVLWPGADAEYNFNFALSSVWCVMITVMLVCVIEPFHRINTQIDKTPTLINYLRCRRWNDERVSNELDTFVRMLMLNKAIHSPIGVITLHRSLLVKIYGCLVTYLVLMVTYGPEAKKSKS